ncbi:MAG: type III-B CRISPR module-associated protein Cmr5 [Aquificaceae bacterium]
MNQERGDFALKEVEKVKNGKGDSKKYKRNARRLPALITTNGLLATLAFLKSKDETKPVYESVDRWLKNRGYVGEKEDALERLLKEDHHKLRLAILEVMAFASWLKRIVEIEIEDEE